MKVDTALTVIVGQNYNKEHLLLIQNSFLQQPPQQSLSSWHCKYNI